MPAVRRPRVLTDGWVPIGDNGPLSPFRELDTLERERRGSEKVTGGWARSEFEDLFKTYPRIEDAYWETIVKLWRLSRLEDDADTEIWQDHFLAWLVSSLSVFELRVTDFRFG